MTAISPKSRPCWARLHLALGVASLSATAALAAPALIAPPNVVLVMTDDQSIGDFGATGNEAIRTPHIDRLASRSASMSQFYVSPVCSPTRASLMTGRYNFRTRVIDTWLGRSMIEPDEVTIAEVLHAAGYRTGIFGKWHLGDCYPMRPIDQGFDEALVHRGGGIGQPTDPIGAERKYTDPTLIHNGVESPREGYCTDIYFDAAQEFIDDAVESGQPFFTYIATNAPHSPYHDVPEGLLREYQQQTERLAELLPPGQRNNKRQIDQLARIAAMITNIDENVGRLRDFLQKKGLEENTMFIFLVDNGAAPERFAIDFRGRKSQVLEAGVRSPLWVCWPAALEAGVTSDEIAAHIDIAPTILDACQVVAPDDDVAFDGRSLLPLLRGEDPDWPDRPIVIQAHRGDAPIRLRNFMLRRGPWKLMNASGFHGEYDGSVNLELYNLDSDPGESEDLAKAQPEIVERLLADYDAWFEDVSSTRPNNYAPPRIVIGSPASPDVVLTREDRRGTEWSTKSVGKWLVTVERGGRYEATLHFLDQDGCRDATVEARGATASATVSDLIATVSLELEPGDCTLRAWGAGSASERRGCHQLIIRRVDSE